MSLPDRWTPMRYHAVQRAYWDSQARFNLMVCGRRSGKTELFKRKLVLRAIEGSQHDQSNFFAGAPTHQQAKRIFWRDLKDLVPVDWRQGQPSETELVIRLVTGSDIHVIGFDKPERFEGTPWDGGGIDEYANIKPTAWGEHIFPALADRQGWCDRFGVPEGRNHYYDEDQLALKDIAENPETIYGRFHWKSAEILPESEIQIAKQTLDELTYLQEYEASFVNFHGRAYYPFTQDTHVASLNYSPRHPLILCFDFNVDPGVAVVAQEQELPNGLDGTGVIGEVHIPRNSNTPAVCRKLLADWGGHDGRVICYGDYTGGARGTARVQGSDWDLIKAELKPVFQDRLSFDVVPNPKEADRINAVNSRLRSMTGQMRLMVDRNAPQTIKDFDGVSLLEGGAKEIDKKKTPELTHLTDAIGYYVARKYPVRGNRTQIIKVSGF